MKELKIIAAVALTAAVLGGCRGAAPANCKCCRVWEHPDSSAWEDVFDKTLSNAEMPAGSWKYNDDGWLVPVTSDTIFSKRDYGSCVVDLVYVMAPSANSGLFLYDTEHPKKKFEVQILDDFHPMYRNERADQLTGAIYGRKAATPCNSNPPGEENRMTVWCEGRRIRIAVNGLLVCDADLEDFRDGEINPDGSHVPPWHKGFPALATIPRHGRIGLQGVHGSDESVKFKYLKVKELKKEVKK